VNGGGELKIITRIGGLILLLSGLVTTVQAPTALAFNISAATGGDGYTPVVYKNTAGETRIFSIFHNRAPGGLNVNCVVATANTICPGYPTYFSSQSGNSGPHDLYTTTLPHYARDGSQVYFAAQRAADNGIACFDLESGANCGYTQLGTLAPNTATSVFATVDGLEQSGTRLYSFGSDVQAYCFDLSTQAACAGQPYPIAGAPQSMPAYNGNSMFMPHEVAGGRFYFAMNYFNATPADTSRLTCFDPGTNARCAGWTSVAGPAGQVRSVFPLLDTAGIANGICAAAAPTSTLSCYDFLAGSTSAPANLFAAAPSGAMVVEETTLGAKTYFALDKAASGAAMCYDWSTLDPCAGFPSPHFWPTVNGGSTLDYGYTYYQGCMFGLGDAGFLWTFDPVSGTVGDTDCAAVLGAVIPAGLPNTGHAAAYPSSLWPGVLLGLAVALGAILLRKYGFHTL
jgi:hypothetical protein